MTDTEPISDYLRSLGFFAGVVYRLADLGLSHRSFNRNFMTGEDKPIEATVAGGEVLELMFGTVTKVYPVADDGLPVFVVEGWLVGEDGSFTPEPYEYDWRMLIEVRTDGGEVHLFGAAYLQIHTSNPTIQGEITIVQV